MSNILKYTFYRCAESLGVLYFKRYWINGGSYWNNLSGRRLNGSNQSDLRFIANSSICYFLAHTVMCLFNVYQGYKIYRRNNIPFYRNFWCIMFGIFTTADLYVLMFQTYNYLKAHDRLAELQL